MDIGTAIFLIILVLIIIGVIVVYFFFKDSFMNLFTEVEDTIFGEAKATGKSLSKKEAEDICSPGGGAFYEKIKEKYKGLEEDDIKETCMKAACGENLEKCE